MRIGILTFHFPDNYGALLQSFSLYSYLNHDGKNDVEIIDYRPSSQNEYYFGRTRSLKTVIRNIFLLPYYPAWKRRVNELNRFRETIKLSKSYSDWSEIPFEEYDVVVTGSDQTFNLNFDFTEVYYQPYKKNSGQRKVAYAPSFGSTLLNDSTSMKISRWVIDFDSLSSREEDGALFLSNLTKNDVIQVLDPVFLLSRDEWERKTDTKLKYKNFIFVYDLNGKENLIRLARRKSPDKDIVIYSRDSMMPYKSLNFRKVHFLQDLSISEFLSYIAYSDFIVTDSFHGLAFSLIFEKQVFPYIALEKASSRIKSLLKLLRISDLLTHDIDESFIDYLSIKPRMNELIKISRSYLNNSVGYEE